MFYEVIFENGDSSIMSVENETEALEAIKTQHERATKGERSLASDPNSPPASRIKRVLVYDKHPNEYHPDNVVSTKDASEALKAHEADGSVDIYKVINSLRGLTDPMVNNPSPHDTKFHMKETRELNEKEWASV